MASDAWNVLPEVVVKIDMTMEFKRFLDRHTNMEGYAVHAGREN